MGGSNMVEAILKLFQRHVSPAPKSTKQVEEVSGENPPISGWGIPAYGKYKFVLFSAHDITLAALLSALGIFDGTYPRYASSLRFELHKEEVCQIGQGGMVGQETCWHVNVIYNEQDITENLCDSGEVSPRCAYGSFVAQLLKLTVADVERLDLPLMAAQALKPS